MPMMTITVQGTEAPKPGKKRGRIKSETGMLFQANPEIIEGLIMGLPYEVAYKDEKFGDVSYRVVEAIYPKGGAPQLPMHRVGGATQQRVTAPVTEDRRGEDIATLAIVKEWIKSIPVGDTGAVVHALKSARSAWLQFKKGTADPKIESGPSLKDELNDEIPEF